MAERYRTAAGNWSDVTKWDGGVSLPGVGDDCYLNNFAMTLDQNVTVASIRNRAGTTAVAGGSLTVSTSRTINANLYAGTASLVLFTGAAGTTLTLNGTARASLTSGNTCVLISGGGHLLMVGDVYGSESGGVVGVGVSTNSGSGGTFNITGNIYAGTVNGAYGINTTSLAGASSVTGDLYGNLVGAGQAILCGHVANTLTINGNLKATAFLGTVLNISSAGGATILNGNIEGSTTTTVAAVTISGAHTLTVNGTVNGGAASGNGAYGISITGGATVTVNGTAVGGVSAGGTGYGVFVNSAGATVYVKKAKGNDYPNGGAAAPAPGVVCNNAAYVVTVAQLEFGSGGVAPVSGGRYFVDDAAVNECKMRQSNAGAITTMGDVPADYANPANVRDGTVYAFGARVGTLKVPPPASVAYGVPTDNTTGTAALLTQAQVGQIMGEVLAAASP